MFQNKTSCDIRRFLSSLCSGLDDVMKTSKSILLVLEEGERGERKSFAEALSAEGFATE
jgi:hypothetical protein